MPHNRSWLVSLKRDVVFAAAKEHPETAAKLAKRLLRQYYDLLTEEEIQCLELISNFRST